ncbi:ATPase [Methylobacterium sp. P1-11]|uniref:ATPase n=1 Tax=Methylobacterium sp. P1-11 TaxID=2024616 RepID=UPI0011EDC5B1|nr:ATPase [Methylobacterium sp. P1-11]KAA0124529.1 ATPase [Methylobacterium sp. P1-11]
MSEPARSLSPTESGSFPATGPLRDWLTAMKAQAPMETRSDVRSVEAQPEPKRARGGEAAWSPRVVPGPEVPRATAEDPDIAELMAENLMLKAKLRMEAERQDELQAILADEIRTLREHIRDEIGSLEDLRTEQEEVRSEREEFRSERERFRIEREELRAERDRAMAERDALRSERLTLAGERDSLREERDLWRARTEALAQPLFQAQRR